MHGNRRVGDFYPGAGGSTFLDTHVVANLPRGDFYRGRSSREADLHLPVTPSTSSAGVKVGQFTLAQATVGLLVLLGAIAYMDKRVV